MRRRTRQMMTVGGTLAMLVLTVYLSYLPSFDAQVQEKTAGPLRQLLVEYQWEIVVPLGLGALLLPLIPQFISRQSAVEVFLRYLHRRNWGSGAGSNPDYRVSLFVPAFGSKLRCLYRTDRRVTKKRWDQIPTDGSDGHGVVGYVFMNGTELPVAGIDPDTDPASQVMRDYLRSALMSLNEYNARSWKGAGMHGIPIYATPDEIVGVLLVECRQPQSPISPTPAFNRDAEVCGLILQGRL